MKEIHLGRVLSENRRRKGVTQDELAEFMGVSKAAVSKWETESTYPDILLLPRLAACFDLLDAWFDSALELGDYPPRDELLIRRSMTQALTGNPAFDSLADDPRFQVMTERLKLNEKQ